MRTLLLFFLLLPVAAMAQRDTSMMEQYCRVKIEPIPFTTKLSLEMEGNEEHRAFSDNRLRDEDGKVKRFNTVTAVLNYMGGQGWQLMNVYPAPAGSSGDTWYLFKKLFKRMP